MLPATTPDIWYHGSSTNVLKGHRLMPPSTTGILQEAARRINMDRVFFTRDKGLARIYAGRAVRRFGGDPVVYRAIPMGGIETLSDRKGATIAHSPWGFIEPLTSSF